MVVLLAVELIDELLLAAGKLVSGDLLAAGLVLVVLLAVQLVLLGLGALDLDRICLEGALHIGRCFFKACGNA